MTSPTDAPGRRLKNPLGALSSYTYQLSLYMITPDAYDAFNATGRRSINALAEATGEENTGGAYLIAQSGGINNETSQRAPGFDLDYYIDNFKLKQAINGAATQSSTNTYSVSFDIIEPYGFSFNTKLKRASDQLQSYYNETGYSGNGEVENPSRQFFIIGVRFLGYDENGDLIRGDLDFEGDVLDPNASGNSLFQTYYDISITGIKFSIEGGATRYALSGVALSPGKAFGTKRGRIDSTKTISGQTFDQAMQGGKPDADIPGVGLLTQLNEIEAQKVQNGDAEFPNIYSIEYIGDGVDAIKDARLILPTDTDKSKWCGPDGGALDIDQATDAEAATAVPDDAHRKIIFNGDTTFIEIFDEVLKGSGYMYDALKAIYKSQVTPDLTTGEQPQEDPGSDTKVGWYKVTPVIQKAKWDSIVVDWAYQTIFRIERYETPIITTSVTNPSMDYYGPHKRYEYWWTGENREILEYSQKLDNLFYNEVLGNANLNIETVDGAEAPADEKGKGSGGAAQTPIATNKKTSMPSLNAVGGGRASQNEYVTSLYSPDSYATAKIKILGDPDFLVQEHRGSPDSLYQRFYGDDGFRVTANGGQVFIEIDFKEAIDYNGETGVMDLNESILFFRYPSALEDTIKGVSYKIITIDSTFNEGKFTQDLSCAINTFADPDPIETAGAEEGTAEEGETENTEGTNDT